MPQRFTVARIERQKISHGVAGKSQTGIRGQYSRAGSVGTKFMAPTDFASLVVNRFQHALAPNPVIGTRPTVHSIRRLGKIDAVAGVSIHDKQTVLGIETWRP